jgi:tetratricopeptide (TPR) repeat protein
MLGDLTSARAFADAAIASDPSEIRAWIAAAEVSAASGDPAPVAPEQVATDRQYRVMLAETAVRHGDWDRALELTGELLHENDRSPEVLELRAIALADNPVGPSDAQPWHEVDRLTTEAISAIDETDPLTVQGLVLRSVARLRLGQTNDAQADSERARQLDRDNPEVLRHAAEARIQSGDDAGALQILLSPATDKDPMLLAVRGGLRHTAGEKAGALADLNAAWVLIPNSSDPDPIRTLVAKVALDADDLDLAEQAIESLSSDGKNSWHDPYLRGQLAFARGQMEDGTNLFREASRRATAAKSFVLLNLAERLLRSGDAAASVQAFDEVGRPSIPSELLPVFVQALMKTGDFARSQELVDELAKLGPLPQWAVEVATDIAFRREEPEEAIHGLKELIARGGGSTRISIALAKALIDVDQPSEASACLDDLLQTPDLSPIELMQAAELLRAVGRGREAVDAGFRGFRRESSSPDVQRSFATIVFMSGVGVPPAEEVGLDTYIRLKRSDGTTREYVVYGEPPIDPLRNEIDVEDAAAKGLIGLRQGAEYVANPGTRNQERWIVESILPASVHAAQDIVAHFGDRFERQPFFVEQIPVGENLENLPGVAQLIGALGEQNKFQEAVVNAYREQVLPLGMISQRLGCMIVEFMSGAITEPDKVGPLVVEWANAAGQSRSVQTARTCTTAVLTRSGLETAYSLGLLGQLAASMSIVAPRSLLDELRGELKEDKSRVDSGYSKLGAGGPAGLSMTSLPANDPGLVLRYEVVKEQLAWVELQRIEARPLESIRPVGSAEEEVRGFLGRSSYDAVVLAQRPNAALYADDLGLRRLSLSGGQPESFSTVSLLVGFAERGLITGEDRDRQLLRLVLSHYAFVSPTSELLDLAVRQEPTNGRPALQRAFALLATESITANEAARIAIAVIKAAALRAIKTVSIESLTEMALKAMAARWKMPLCLTLVSYEAGQQLRLMPQHQESVRRVVASLRSR